MNFDFKNFSSLSELKNLPVKDLPEFCNQLRQFLLHEVSQSGGHLASNLGTVELTVALHYVFAALRASRKVHRDALGLICASRDPT